MGSTFCTAHRCFYRASVASVLTIKAFIVIAAHLLPLPHSQQWEIHLVCPIASNLGERCICTALTIKGAQSGRRASAETLYLRILLAQPTIFSIYIPSKSPFESHKCASSSFASRHSLQAVSALGLASVDKGGLCYAVHSDDKRCTE